jgi:hypothetical protein
VSYHLPHGSDAGCTEDVYWLTTASTSLTSLASDAGRRLLVAADMACSAQLHASRREDHSPEVRGAVIVRARPMAASASSGSGTSVVYHKEGIDPCKCQAVYCAATPYCE